MSIKNTEKPKTKIIRIEKIVFGHHREKLIICYDYEIRRQLARIYNQKWNLISIGGEI